MDLQQIKAQLRDGPWAWPGGYPKFFIMADGEALSFESARANWKEIVRAHLDKKAATGRCQMSDWFVLDCDINWEDESLTCAQSGKPIECAYPSEGDRSFA